MCFALLCFVPQEIEVLLALTTSKELNLKVYARILTHFQKILHFGQRIGTDRETNGYAYVEQGSSVLDKFGWSLFHVSQN